MQRQRFPNLLAALTITAIVGLAQTPQQSGTLSVAGYSGQIPVIEIEGKVYVDVDALARLANGSVGYPANQMTLTLPPPDAGSDPKPKTGFSTDFLKSGIEAITAIREWRAALVHAVQNNYPLSEEWLGNFRRTAEAKRALVSVEAMTDSDRNTLPLLDNEMSLMQKMNDMYLGLYRSATYVTADSVDRNPLNQQILDCTRGLAALAASGQYQDVPSCH